MKTYFIFLNQRKQEDRIITEGGCMLPVPLKKVRTSGVRIKMAYCANVARERPPQNLERRKIQEDGSTSSPS